MKLFNIRGGVHPQERKERSASSPIESIPMPEMLRVPVQQHIGNPAIPTVHVGDKVLKGQLLAHGQGMVSAPIHAPTSGTVAKIGNYHAPHPSGLPVLTVTIKTDGEDEWVSDLTPVDDPFALTPEDISKRVAAAGIVGMGGATFPSAVKLNLRKRYSLETLVINGAECEPYLTCDDRLMQEYTAQVLDGIRIMGYALGVKNIIIAIENNKPKAQQYLKVEAEKFNNIKVIGVPTRYPMGSEKHLVQTLTGLETPARALTADIGVVVHNVATAFAVHEALREGKPLVSRVVTVSGGAMREAKNLRVLIGTPVQHLIDYCGGFHSDPNRLLLGGPMMGQLIPTTKVPIVKGSNGVLALTHSETHTAPEMPCIRCARCVNACPCGLLPLDMAAFTKVGDLEGATTSGLLDCILCGSCAYVCPSHIPLVQYFHYAKGDLVDRQRQQYQQEETKRLITQRTERLEREAREKRERLAKQKAAKAQAEANP